MGHLASFSPSKNCYDLGLKLLIWNEKHDLNEREDFI